MAVTNNYSLVLPTVGGDTNLWGGLLNNGVITTLDTVLSGNLAVSMTSSNVTLTATQFQNAIYTITGTLTANVDLIVPLSPNSGSVACAGDFIVDNQTTGPFTITVKTAASGSTGVLAAQGYKSCLYSDGTDVWFSDDQNRSTLATVSGNPNGSSSGRAGAANTVASALFDRTNGVLYICTETGTVWGGIAAGTVRPQGYLTLNSSTSTVVVTTDTTAATTVYYSPFVGNLVPISNGTYFTLQSFGQLSLTLTSSQAANNIYDVFAFMDGSTLRIGTGPSWTAGSGGSITAGAGARGTGAGSTALQRLNGLWVNTNSMTVINGLSSYSVDALEGTYLGSLYIDSTQGQISCHVSAGQSRKWGVFNAYNQQPITLQERDSTASWVPSASWAPFNNDATNVATAFVGLSSTPVTFTLSQLAFAGAPQGSGTQETFVGIGINSTTTTSGRRASVYAQSGTINASVAVKSVCVAQYFLPTSLGINSGTALGSVATAGGTIQNPVIYGGTDNMLFLVEWLG